MSFFKGLALLTLFGSSLSLECPPVAVVRPCECIKRPTTGSRRNLRVIKCDSKTDDDLKQSLDNILNNNAEDKHFDQLWMANSSLPADNQTTIAGITFDQILAYNVTRTEDVAILIGSEEQAIQKSLIESLVNDVLAQLEQMEKTIELDLMGVRFDVQISQLISKKITFKRRSWLQMTVDLCKIILTGGNVEEDMAHFNRLLRGYLYFNQLVYWLIHLVIEVASNATAASLVLVVAGRGFFGQQLMSNQYRSVVW